MQKNKKNIVVDFDETLFSSNSFTLWCGWLLRHYFFNFHYLNFLKLIILFIKRKLLSDLTHDEFKFQLIKLVATDTHEEFAEYLMSQKWNEKIIEHLRHYDDQDVSIIISSAAPLGYLKPSIEKKSLNTAWILGANISEKGILNGNYEQVKADNILELVGHSEIDILYTDSIDDLPTMKVAAYIYVVCRPIDQADMQSILHSNNIVNFEFISP